VIICKVLTFAINQFTRILFVLRNGGSESSKLRKTITHPLILNLVGSEKNRITQPRRSVFRFFMSLFTPISGLSEELLELPYWDKANNKPLPFFDDLLVSTARSAVGAHYNVLGYRLWDVDKLFSMRRATDRNFARLGNHGYDVRKFPETLWTGI
jgi:hypothetical protein